MIVAVTHEAEERSMVQLQRVGFQPDRHTDVSTVSRLRRLIGRFPGLQHAYRIARRSNRPAGLMRRAS